MVYTHRHSTLKSTRQCLTSITLRMRQGGEAAHNRLVQTDIRHFLRIYLLLLESQTVTVSNRLNITSCYCHMTQVSVMIGYIAPNYKRCTVNGYITVLVEWILACTQKGNDASTMYNHHIRTHESWNGNLSHFLIRWWQHHIRES